MPLCFGMIEILTPKTHFRLSRWSSVIKNFIKKFSHFQGYFSYLTRDAERENSIKNMLVGRRSLLGAGWRLNVREGIFTLAYFLTQFFRTVSDRNWKLGQFYPNDRTKMDLVSVIIPIHNSSIWIEPLFESILAQTYTGKVEICVWDDSSTDDGAEEVEKFYKRVEERSWKLKIGQNNDQENVRYQLY